MNQIHIYLFTFLLQNYNIKEATCALLKVNNNIGDAKNYFPMQKLNSIFKICFNYDLQPPNLKNPHFSYDRNIIVQQICREAGIITQF